MSNSSVDDPPAALERLACARYAPGHQIHIVQAKLTWGRDRAIGTAVLVEDDGWALVELEGELLWLWNHQPERLRWCLHRADGLVELAGHGLLHVPTREAQYCFSVASDGPSPCLPPPSPGATPLEQLRSHGGFLVPPQQPR